MDYGIWDMRWDSIGQTDQQTRSASKQARQSGTVRYATVRYGTNSALPLLILILIRILILMIILRLPPSKGGRKDYRRIHRRRLRRAAVLIKIQTNAYCIALR